MSQLKRGDFDEKLSQRQYFILLKCKYRYIRMHTDAYHTYYMVIPDKVLTKCNLDEISTFMPNSPSNNT